VSQGVSGLVEWEHGVEGGFDGAILDEAAEPLEVGVSFAVDDEGKPLA
jgi:hypothetical protein